MQPLLSPVTTSWREKGSSEQLVSFHSSGVQKNVSELCFYNCTSINCLQKIYSILSYSYLQLPNRLSAVKSSASCLIILSSHDYRELQC